MLAGAAHADPKREVPDYDGRGNPDSEPETWVAWIPRVVLAPFYAVSEYVIRRPLGALVSTAERHHWAESVEEIFTFGKNNDQVIVPTALWDFGLLPSVGLYYAGADLFVPHNTLRIHAATWGKPWIVTTIADRYNIDNASSVQGRFEFRRAEDNIFFGIGPDVTSATRSRYGLQREEGTLAYRQRFMGESFVQAHLGLHHISFTDGTCCDDPQLLERVAEGTLMLPPGYGDAYTAAFGVFEVQLDTRAPRPLPGSGAYLNLVAQPNFEIFDHRSWMQYGGVIGGAVDLTGHQRVLKLQLAVAFADDLAGSAMPFTEYPVLGGDQMPGYIPGWLTGKSTAVAQLGYTWPVWIGIDGQTRFSLGNAYNDHLSGLAPGTLRWSWDIGLATNALRDQGLEFLVGLGSETFDQGGHVTSVRVAVGSRQGF
jgi:hypothetical protein